jgi:GLPGLI family protein
MKIPKLLVSLLVLCYCPFMASQAQTVTFLKKGKIEYEKTLNILALIKEMYAASPGRDQLLDNFQKNYKPFHVTHFDLYFNGDSTYYVPGTESPQSQNLPEWVRIPAQDNRIFTDLKKQQSVSLKNIFNIKYLITDSTRKIRWKITDEAREIAGFPCRRANAIIMDSIYAVAFYTTQIKVSGGPESVSGLPGMILGLALPHEHVTWFATNVYLRTDMDKIARPPAGNSKQMGAGDFYSTLRQSLKDWRTTGNLWLKICMF